MRSNRDPGQGDAIGDIALASQVALYSLWCDQGMANLVEIYEQGGDQFVPAGMVLLDFGASSVRSSEVIRKKYAPPVYFIIERLRALMDANLDPRIDRLVISHQDWDHWSLINILLEECRLLRIPLQFGQVRYGGLEWGPSANTLLKRLATYTPGGAADVIPWGGTYSDYLIEEKRKTEMFHCGDVVFRSLVVNAPVSKADTKNGTSAIMVVEYQGAGATYVLPGDATGETMLWAANQMRNWEAEVGAPAVRPCYVLTAPHHGAWETARDKSAPDGEELQLLRDFVGQIRPHSVLASAGATNGYSHPHREVLNTMSAYAGDFGLSVTHPIVYSNGVKNQWFQEFTDKNTYTTVLNNTVLPAEVADFIFWLYRSDGPDQRFETLMLPFVTAIEDQENISVLAYKQLGVGGRYGTTNPPGRIPPVTPPGTPPVKRVVARSFSVAGRGED